MHEDQKVQRFIELRAQGYTYARLKVELNPNITRVIASSAAKFLFTRKAGSNRATATAACLPVAVFGRKTELSKTLPNTAKNCQNPSALSCHPRLNSRSPEKR